MAEKSILKLIPIMVKESVFGPILELRAKLYREQYKWICLENNLLSVGTMQGIVQEETAD